MKVIHTIVVAVVSAAVSMTAAELPVVSAENGFKAFCASGRVKVVLKGDVMEASEFGKDSQILLSFAPFPAAAADGITIRYRAFGEWTTPGEIYFSNSGPTGFHDSRRWKLPAPVTDGMWHKWKLTEKDLSDVGNWRNAGLITNIRLDPVNDPGKPGGRIEFAEIRFTDSRSQTAAQVVPPSTDHAFLARFDAPRWPVVKSEMPKIETAPTDLSSVEVVSTGGTVEPLRARAGETVKMRFDFQGPRPELPCEVKVSLFGNDSLVWDETLVLGRTDVRPRGLGRWRFEFDYVLPLYPDSCRMKAMLTSPSLRVMSSRQPEAEFSFMRVATVPGYEKPVKASVMEVGGVPRFAIDGKPIAAMWGTASWRRRPDRTARHSGAPLELVTLWPDTRGWWPRGEELNPIAFDCCAEALRRGYPADCRFIVSIPLYPPSDWAAANPDDMAQNHSGAPCTDGPAGMTNYSYSSRKARELMARMLEKAIRYLEGSPYANRIVGYRVDSGHTFEWLGWDPVDKDGILDFSPVAQRAFRDYLKAHGLESLGGTVPGFAERHERDGASLVWDQARHRRTVAYHDFYCNELADTAIFLCRRAKELVGRDKLVGTYFGYVMTLFDGGNQMRAHYATRKVLNSGAFDFLLSPQSYGVRNLGDTCGDMKPFRSMQDHGIVPALEDDTRTHNSPDVPYMVLPTEFHSVGVLRRNMAMCLCRGEPFYSLPIIDGADMDFPAFAMDVDACRTATEFAIEKGIGRQAEIAVVVSEESIKSMPMHPGEADRYPDQGFQTYLKDGTVFAENLPARSVISDNYRNVYTRILRLGTGCDYLLAEDLPNAKRHYKLYVFLNCLKATDGFIRAAAALRQRDCSLLWAHAPGFVSDNGNSVAHMKDLTGLDFELCEGAFDPAISLKDGRLVGGTGSATAPYFSPLDTDESFGTYAANGKTALSMKRTGKATTWFCGSYKLDLPVLKMIADRAGVRAFTDSGDPVESNDAFFMLHARFAGRKTVTLPRKASVVDVFARKIVARDVTCFSFDAPLHSTHFFYYGMDADALVDRLNR